MIRRTIENLRQRSRDERLAFSGAVAVGVMFVLFIIWAFFFLSSLRNSTPDNESPSATTTVSQ